MKKFIMLLIFIPFLGSVVFGQTKVLTGTVTSSDDGMTIPGVSVIVKGTTIGTVTGPDGVYELTVPSSASTLVFQFIGMKTVEVPIESSNTIDMVMDADVFGLDEVVVTGVASGTATKKIGFAMTKVDGAALEAVPAMDASNSLRAKVAGVTIVQSQGDGEASVSIRGAKSIFGNISPLVIVDGILTNQSLGDINTSDIARIEVVKGAAASSLYGSLAAGGVVQIITKRGRETSGVHVELRSEYGISDIEKTYPAAMSHPFLVNPDGSFDLSTGDRQLDPNNVWTDYGAFYDLYDNVEATLENQAFFNEYASVSNSGKEYSMFGSVQYQSKGGIAEPLDPETQMTVRFNADYFPSPKFTARVSTSYTNNEYVPVSRGDQGTFFSTVLLVEPWIDLTQKDADGDYEVYPDGFEVQNANISNILYSYNNIEYGRNTQRFVGGIDLKYQLFDALSLQFAQSFDKRWSYNSTYYPVGYKTVNPSASLNNGNYALSTSRNSYSVTSAQVNYNESFGFFNLGLVGKYLYEFEHSDGFSASGRNLTTRGIYDLGITQQDQRSIGSSQNDYVTKNFFVSGDVDYMDKIIVNGLIRWDGSSLFGADARWQTFWRGSVAYRVTEDFDIPGFDELKARVSYGTAGRRPTWSGQYETFSVSSSSITANILGNANLKPAVNKEFEVGFDASFLGKFSAQVSYAFSTIYNDFIWRNLSLATSAFRQQYQNLGAVESSSFEVQLTADLVRKSNFSWEANMTFDRIRSQITDLGGIPPFTNGIYRVETDQPVGVFYGNEVMRSLSELTTDGDGYVNNAWNLYNPVDPTDNHTPDEFSVNNLGYVVLTSTIGTTDEFATFYRDLATGDKEMRVIGDRNPDFKIGFGNTFTFFKNLQLYVLLDWKQGGDKYDNTKQYMFFNYRHQDQADWAEKGHHVLFSTSANSIYNANDYCSAFVYDASYLKVREMALSYTIREPFAGLDRIKLSVIGRNLLTFTKYESYDPEGYYEQFEYPVFRTLTGSIQVSF